MNNDALDQLLQQPGIWRAGEPARSTGLSHVSSGFAELDASLPGGGWALGSLTEILHEQAGIGELRLLMPALARLSRGGRWIALIAPPHIPYAPALAAHGIDLSRLLLVHPRSAQEGLWALEQALRAGTCGAVLAWPRQIDDRSLRRLQLAAEAGRCWGVLFRPASAREQASPAALRLELRAAGDGTAVRLLKCRGGRSDGHLLLDLDGQIRRRPANPPLPESPLQALPPCRPLRAAPPPRSRQLLAGRGRLPQLELPLSAPEPATAPAAASSHHRWRRR